MIDLGKKLLLGTCIDALDYDAAVARIFSSVRSQRPCTTAALAVHGLMTAAFDPSYRRRLNSFELVVPDGQPVRWAINALYGAKLSDRVYGPKLMRFVCLEAAKQQTPVFFYGSKANVLEQLCSRITALCPGLRIVGASPSLFRPLTPSERADIVRDIQQSGARILFVGLGCPRQEIFTYDISADLKMPILAVGAAFDYYSGLLKEPPEAIQKLGLQWLYRLLQEPRRLWRRYLITNTQFVFLFLLQWLGLLNLEEVKADTPPTKALYD